MACYFKTFCFKIYTPYYTISSNNLKQFLEQGKTEFYLQELSFQEFKQALQAQNGRYTKALKSIFNENNKKAMCGGKRQVSLHCSV